MLAELKYGSLLANGPSGVRPARGQANTSFDNAACTAEIPILDNKSANLKKHYIEIVVSFLHACSSTGNNWVSPAGQKYLFIHRESGQLGARPARNQAGQESGAIQESGQSGVRLLVQQ